jgi:DnaK suppressor protein
MEKRLLATARQALIEKRRVFIRRSENTLAEEQRLLDAIQFDRQDHDRELSAAWLLDQVADVELAHLRQVQAALDRLEQGRYGQCVRCADAIDEARLQALPEVDRCAACAGAN